MNNKLDEVLEDYKIIKFKTISAGYDYGYEVWNKIEQALLELKAIKETKLSEALKIVDSHLTFLEKEKYNVIGLKQDFITIKQALLKAQETEKKCDEFLLFEDNQLTSGFAYKGKQIIAMPLDEYSKLMKLEKAWEVVKKKDVDIYILQMCKTVDEYNSKIVHIIGETRELIQEDFELIKEMLL